MNQQQQENKALIENPNTVVVEFDEGYTIGNETIKSVTLTKPKTHALRGLKLNEVLTFDVDTIAKLATRISSPTMIEQHVYDLSVADFTKLSMAIAGFFVDTSDSLNQ